MSDVESCCSTPCEACVSPEALSRELRTDVFVNADTVERLACEKNESISAHRLRRINDDLAVLHVHVWDDVTVGNTLAYFWRSVVHAVMIAENGSAV